MAAAITLAATPTLALDIYGSVQAAEAAIRTGDYPAAISKLRAAAGAAKGAEADTIETDLAQALTEDGDYSEGLVMAQKARDDTRATSGPMSRPYFEALMVLARAEGLSGAPIKQAVDTLLAAAEVAKVLSGQAGADAVRVGDRMSILVSATDPKAALAANDQLLDQADAIKDITPALLARLANSRGVILIRGRNYADARKAFEVALDARRKLLGDTHPETLETLHNLGITLRFLGETSQAEQLLEQALAARRAKIGPAHPDTLATDRAVAGLLLRGDPERGLAEYRQIVAATTRRYGPTDTATLDSRAALSTALDKTGHAEEGLREIAETYAAAVQARPATDLTRLDLGHQYGLQLQEAGQPAQALSVLNEVLLGTRVAKSDTHPDTLATLSLIADVENDLGERDRSCALQAQVVAGLPPGGGQNELNRLTVENNLAICRWGLGQHDDAIKMMREVVVRRTALLGPTNSSRQGSVSALGAWLSEGGGHEEAIRLQREVYDARKAQSLDAPPTLNSEHNLAAALDAAHQWDEALRLYADVVARRTRVLGPQHPDTLLSLRAQAGLLLESGQFAAARAAYDAAMAVVEHARADPALGDVERRAYFAQVADLYKVDALLSLHAGDAPAAWRATERAKARSLLEMSAGREARRRLLSAADAGALTDLDRQIARIDAAPPEADAAKAAARAAERARLVGNVDHAEQAIAEKNPTFAEASQPREATPDALIAALDDGTALLDFLVIGDRVMMTWATRAAPVAAMDLGAIPHLARTVESYRAILSNPRGLDGLRNPAIGEARKRIWRRPDGSFELRLASEDPPDETSQLVTDEMELSRALSHALLDALPTEVRSRRRWIVSPDGPLSLMPLEALSVDGARVLDRHDLAYAPSLSVLSQQIARSEAYGRQARGPLIALGAPNYAATHGQFAALPASGHELRALTQLFNLKPGVTLFEGNGATRDRLLGLGAAGRLRRTRYLVVSAHGVLDPAAPDRNAIVLTPSGRDGGYVRSAEIMTLDLQTDLVFLSACDTAAGRWNNGEGMLGLPFALTVAGSASSVLTQWSLPDVSAAEFSRRFFARLKSGVGAAQALAETKRDFADGRASPDWRAPAFWAGYVYFGPVGRAPTLAVARPPAHRRRAG